MKRKYFAFLILFLQLVFLAGMVIFQQSKLDNAKRILLETIPYDPKSIFRGHYASLNYKINSLPISLLQDTTSKKLKSGQELFVLLGKQDKYWEAQAIYARKPKNDNRVYIRGRLENYYSSRFSYEPKKINLEYGIESFFLSQDLAVEVDRRDNWRERNVRRKEMAKQLDPETKRIYDAGLSGWWYKKFETELKVLSKEGIISQEAQEKINKKYSAAFEKINDLENMSAPEEKPLVVEVAIDSEYRGHPLKLLLDGKVYQ